MNRANLVKSSEDRDGVTSGGGSREVEFQAEETACAKDRSPLRG